MSNFLKKIASLVCIMLCVTLFVSQTLWSAAYQNRGESHEVIILLDLSASDLWYESGILSAEGLSQLMDGLPDSWHVGLVTFDRYIVNSITPSADTRALVHAALSEFRYEHIYRSPTFFSGQALSHTIVLLSNEEMAVLEFGDSARLANTAIEEIVSTGLSVHSLNLSDTHNQIERDNLDSRDLSAPEFSFVADTLPGQGIAQNFSVYLSGEPSDSRRVMIASENVVHSVFVSADSHATEVEFGQRFGIIEIGGAYDALVQVDFYAVGQTALSAVSAQDAQSFTSVDSTQPTRFWLTGSAEDSLFLSSFFDGGLVPLFTEGVMPQLGLNITAIDEPPPQVLQQPQLPPTTPTPFVLTPTIVAIDPPTIGAGADDADDEDNDDVDNEANEEQGEITEPAQADDPPATYTPEPYTSDETEPYTEYEESARFNFFIIWFVIIAALLVLLLFLARRKKQDKQPRTKGQSRAAKQERAKRVKEQKAPLKKVKDTPQPKVIPAPIPALTKEAKDPKELLEFAEKFDIYLNQTDTSPAAFALFKLGKGKQVTLQKMLSKCSNMRISGDLAETKNICFAVDKQGVLTVTNDSTFKVCIKDNQLQMNETRTLSQGDNIHVSFGGRELVLSPRFLYRAAK